MCVWGGGGVLLLLSEKDLYECVGCAQGHDGLGRLGGFGNSLPCFHV